MDIGPLLSGIRSSDVASIASTLNRSPILLNRPDARLGLTPLFHAVILSKLEVVALLLERGADPDFANSSGETPLHQAVDESDFAVVKELLAYGADANARNDSGESPLHSAVYHGDAQVTELLLKHGSDANSQTRTTGKSPLHVAIDSQSIECALFLLEHGGDLFLEDAGGLTPQGISIENGIHGLLQQEYSSLAVEGGLKTITEISEEDILPVKFPSVAQPRAPVEEPDAEICLLSPAQSNLHSMLKEMSLEKYYHVLASAGYNDLNSVLTLTVETLRELGVPEIGSCAAILLTAHQRAGTLPEYTIIHQAAPQRFSLKCGARVLPSHSPIDSIDLWLHSLSLPYLCPLFTAAGYTSLDLLFLQMNSPFPVTEGTLLSIGIESRVDRESLLARLASDSPAFIGKEPTGFIVCSCTLL